MELETWLKAERGRAAALAKHINKSPTAITLWCADGVPMPLMREVCLFTKGAVSLPTLLAHALRRAEERRSASEVQREG